MIGTLLAAAIAITAIAFATFSTVEALEERRAATGAMQLQIASMEISADEALHAFANGTTSDAILPLIDTLSTDHDTVLHSLEADEHSRVDALISKIMAKHQLNPETRAMSLDSNEYRELEALLTSAATRANEDAIVAERHALFAVIAAAIAMMTISWTLLRWRFQAGQARTAVDARLREGQRFETLLNDSPAIFVVLREDGTVTYRSASADDVLTSDLDRDGLLDLFIPEDRARLLEHLQQDGVTGASAIFSSRGPTGRLRTWEIRVSDLRGNDLIGGHLVTTREVTYEARLREELREQATTDPLTGLANRRALQPTLGAAVQRMHEDGGISAFLAIDLDRFKAINDALGHRDGDTLLRLVAERLRRSDSAGALLRLGGDEFTAVLPLCVRYPIEAKQAGDQFLRSLRDPFVIGLDRRVIGASVGVAVTGDPEQVADLLHRSDIALYEAKRLGGGRTVLFNEPMEAAVSRPNQITRALRAADKNAEFSLVFQPIVNTVDRQIVSLEALLRWTSPTLGDVNPGEFIEVAEGSGEICAIGAWVLNEVCRQLAVWSEANINDRIAVSFNVSARQLSEGLR
ncbi:MAG: diguanylate cyclase [Acidimicrobiales bacterium]